MHDERLPYMLNKMELRMKKNVSILTIILMGMLILSACGLQQSINSNPTITDLVPTAIATSSETSGQTTPQPPISTEAVPTDHGQKVITLGDQGRTIDLAVGESFLLKLGEEYAWTVNISDQNVLSRFRNITMVRGAQGIYNALQAGTVTLSASGDPVCRQAKPPCAMPSILFSITIVAK
jgi:hypothetical protein